jgi:MFS family permease
MSAQASPQAAMDSAVRHLVANYSPKGDRVGWLMLASILVEAWDLYAIGFVLIFIREQYHPSPLMLGLAAAATQAGALIGAQGGGWLTDKIGRRVMFLTTMFLFIVLALAQAFVTSIMALVIVRLLLGFPLGSDISTGYTYIMEFLPKGRREVVGNRWQFMFGSGSLLAVIVTVILMSTGLSHEMVWRTILGLGAVPAAIIFWLRYDLPETSIWLIRQGRFRPAKAIAREMYNDPLDMLPDQDMVVRKPRPTAFLADIRRDPIRWRATLYGWVSGFCQASEAQTFSFYLPIMFTMVGVSSTIGTLLMMIPLNMISTASGWVAPLLTPKVGHRGIGQIGFGIVWVSLLVAAAALYTGYVKILPFAAAVMFWGHMHSSSNCMTVPSLVAKPEYRGTASGFSYMFVKGAAFFSIFLFPSVFTAIGQANSTLLVSFFSLAGLLAATFLLPEVYGYEHD